MLAEAETKLAEHRSRIGPAEAGVANAAAAAAPALLPAAAPAASGGDVAPAKPEGPNSAAQPAGHDAPHVKGMSRCGIRERSNIDG